MELDRALELAVMSAWDELMNRNELSDELSSIHVEYKNVSGLPLSLVEVWTINERGCGTLAFRYAMPRSYSSTRRVEDPMMHFGNSYRSDTLASNFDFIMRNQGDFTRPGDDSIHGGVQIETPSQDDRKRAAAWSRSIQTKSRVRLGA
jgi:hypothetical protein